MAEREHDESGSPAAAAVGSEQLGEREKSKKKVGRSATAKQRSSSSATNALKKDTSNVSRPTEVAGVDAITAEGAHAAPEAEADAEHDLFAQSGWPGQAYGQPPFTGATPFPPYNCTIQVCVSIILCQSELTKCIEGLDTKMMDT